MNIEIVEYKGKPILKIQEENMRTPFSFGLRKANLILKYIEDIKKFVASASHQEITSPDIKEKVWGDGR